MRGCTRVRRQTPPRRQAPTPRRTVVLPTRTPAPRADARHRAHPTAARTTSPRWSTAAPSGSAACPMMPAQTPAASKAKAAELIELTLELDRGFLGEAQGPGTRSWEPPGPGTTLEGLLFEVRTGFEPAYDGFANRCLTAWLPHRFVCLFRYLLPTFTRVAGPLGEADAVGGAEDATTGASGKAVRRTAGALATGRGHG